MKMLTQVLYSKSFYESLVSAIDDCERRNASHESIEQFVAEFNSTINGLRDAFNSVEVVPNAFEKLSDTYHLCEPIRKISVNSQFTILYRYDSDQDLVQIGPFVDKDQIHLQIGQVEE
ncbi:hypothetical protein [Lentilactobacillus sunkii]|uniref:Type II toxin-antitoxin system RelE/ParE family toxin n=1 Tax=Lentilactobacillus sunkii DSM 19904 TaxID=1423808 RepID=A0A0R1KUJ6_9LACO|nr:hypothetical protein [Lentilactobacillus sunkii]KRK87029.1 hypothetical protein FD17_GL001490 [Lentilactobacillus sunkii DSM 19904]